MRETDEGAGGENNDSRRKERQRACTVAPRVGVDKPIFALVIPQRESIMLALRLLVSTCYDVYFETEV